MSQSVGILKFRMIARVREQQMAEVLSNQLAVMAKCSLSWASFCLFKTDLFSLKFIFSCILIL